MTNIELQPLTGGPVIAEVTDFPPVWPLFVCYDGKVWEKVAGAVYVPTYREIEVFALTVISVTDLRT